MGILDKITGKAKQAAGDVTDDASLAPSGQTRGAQGREEGTARSRAGESRREGRGSRRSRTENLSEASPGRVSDYSIVSADEVEDAYADSDVPGEFRSLKDALGSRAGGGDPDPGAAPLGLRAGHRSPPRGARGDLHRHPRDADHALRRRGRAGCGRLGRPRRAGDHPLAPQRGRRAGRDVGGLAEDRGAATRPRSRTSGSPRPRPPQRRG